jgi:Big-like domain-containing protein
MSPTKHQLRPLCALAALATLALAVSCQGFFPHEQLASITVVPTTATVPLGGTFQMHAYGTNQDNSQAGDVSNQVTWASSSGAITVSADGLLTGVTYSTSQATITATYQALPAESATASICVEGATDFQILPSDATASSSSGVFPAPGGYEATVSAVVNGSAQNVDITTAVDWSTSDPSLVTIGNGTDPATVTFQQEITANQVVTITASYTCNGVAYTPTPTTQLTVTP